ncbi:MAG: lipoyl protein ligase domain-containing protein, partial [Pseudonocardiaceae bacterium]
VRRIETAIIDVCAQLGLATVPVAGRTGVWVPKDSRGAARKVAAIGVRVSYRVTMHGFALNCNPDMAAFDKIVPCGISDVGVTSLTAELGETVTVDDVLPLIRPHLAQLREAESASTRR